MANKNTLLEEFGARKRENVTEDVKDYAVFPDKEKLEVLRAKIVQNLINNQIPTNVSLEQYINDQIDETLEDYSLDANQRAHIFNLIQNEINGYGPLTDLLENDAVTEIMVNGINDIYVEIDGETYYTGAEELPDTQEDTIESLIEKNLDTKNNRFN